MKKITLSPSNIILDELTHVYLRESDNKVFRGITNTLVERAFPHTYDGVSESLLQHTAQRGTNVHRAIERHLMGESFDTDIIEPVRVASELLKQRGLTAVATEYIVTDGENYASPVDLVCADSKGNIVIVDIKTTSSRLYERVQLQCSIYKSFFERQNAKLKVSAIMCLWLHVNDVYDVLDSDLFEMSPVDEEFIGHLIECDLADEEFSVEKFYGRLPAELRDVEDYLKNLDALVKEKTDELKTIKAGLLRLMEEKGIKSFDSGRTRLTRVLGQVRTGFDIESFKRDHPDLYDTYNTKVTVTKESIRITFHA